MLLKLRSDLVFTPQLVDGKSGYLIEDPLKTKFYRIGIAEYKFISLLDGSTSVTDALRATAATLSDQAFTQDEAATICRWLVDAGLAHTRESAQAGRLSAAARDADRTGLLQRLNPMFIRLPLVQPDRFLDSIAPWLGWVHGPLGWTLSAVLALVACCQLMVGWDRFAGAADGIFAPSRWVWLALTWMVLKVVHEVSHGLVCKRYGGSVREGGVIFVLLAPLAYVDVTSSWRFPSKWQRIHTAAAGIYIELVVASMAIIVWSRSGPGVLNDIAFNLVIMASFTTLVFNANPLMRFDGYYIFSDLLEIPNLYPKGQQYVRYLGRSYLLGTASKSPRWSKGKDGIIKLYGVATMLWRVFISVGLVIAATAMFAGAGLVLAIIAAAMWLGSPLLRFAKFFCSDPSLTRKNRVRFVAKTAVLLTLGVLFLTLVPWPGAIQAPAIVEYSPVAIVRAGSPGFVQKLMVKNGQVVEQGEVLVILANDELWMELADLELEIEDTRLLCRMHERNDRMAAYQAELKRRESLEKQHQQKKNEVEQLTVRAPIAGQIVGRKLDALLDTYVSQGGEILSVGNKQDKEIQISVAQEDLERFASHIKKPVMVRVSGTCRFSSVLDKVSPRASTEPLHASLCAPNGGPLAVRRQAADSDTPQSGSESYELLAPRFLAVVALDERHSSPLRAGQRGVASFRDGSDTIGEHIYKSLSRWIRKKFAQVSNTS
ncbi:MAG: hypothetical protein O7G83_14785 [Proteobacteria bacterium]|nr:hypothetical protein [Pseudomonadota bacterium]